MSFLQSKYPRNLRSEALLCVVDFPASETQIYLAHPASHHLRMQASRFAVLVIMRIKLFVCPSMQLAHCRTSCGLWIHRHVHHQVVKPSTYPTPSWRESARESIFGALIFPAVTFMPLFGGDFFRGQYSSGLT